MTDTYQPADYTVDQVNEYLDDHPDQAEAVLAAEAASDSPRVGITEGRHKAPEDATDAAGDDADAPVDLVATSNAQGFHGAVPSQADDADDVAKAKTVEDAAADQDVADLEDSYFGVLPEPKDDTKPVPMADQAPPPEHLAQTEDTQQGYVGTLPDADNRPDLTLAAAAKDAQAQYGDGKPE